MENLRPADLLGLLHHSWQIRNDFWKKSCPFTATTSGSAAVYQRSSLILSLSLSLHPKQSTKITPALAVPQDCSLWLKWWLFFLFHGYLLMEAAWCWTQVIRPVYISFALSAHKYWNFLFSKDRILALQCKPAAVIISGHASGGPGEFQGLEQSWAAYQGPPVHQNCIHRPLQGKSHFGSPNSKLLLVESK